MSKNKQSYPRKESETEEKGFQIGIRIFRVLTTFLLILIPFQPILNCQTESTQKLSADSQPPLRTVRLKNVK
jgi:hypothetical protein